MKAYLVRHGLAVDTLVDPACPLSDTGREEVKRVAARLEEMGVRVGRVQHSGKPRAEQTAAILARAVAAGVEPEARSGLAPMDPHEMIALELAARDGDVMLVGHLPFMDKLLEALVGGMGGAAPVVFTAGTVVCVERNDSGTWRHLWTVSPDHL